MFNVEGKADSQALLELSKAVQQKVYDDFGVFLEYEMEFLGDFLKENIFENKPRQKHAVFDEKIKILREAFQKQMASR